MDEGDTEGVGHVAEVGEPQDDQIEGKESGIYNGAEDCNVIVSHEIILPEQPKYPRSAVQEFMNILDGKGIGGDISFVETLPKHPCTTSTEGAEGRVQELTLENYNALLSSRRDNELETAHETICHVNQQGDRVKVQSWHGPDTDKDNNQETSTSRDNNRDEACVERIPGWVDYNRNASSGLGSSQELAISQNMFSRGNVRTKIISKAGFSEYFVKSTLKGKGVICRGQMLPASTASIRSQNDTKAVVSTADQTEAPLRVGAKLPILPCHGSYEPPESDKQCCSGCDVSLRDWMISQRSKVSKYDILSIFSQILNLVDSFLSSGKVLLDLRPSCFKILADGEVKYCGKLFDQINIETMAVQQDVSKLQMMKRPREHDVQTSLVERSKQQKLHETMDQFRKISELPSGSRRQPTIENDSIANVAASIASCRRLNSNSLLRVEPNICSGASGSHPDTSPKNMISVTDQFEERWYRSPEELCGRGCNSSSNVYALGVLLFEMLGCFDSESTHISAMFDVCHRIFPPEFLSQNPKEAGFCLWLLHPEPSLRPTTRDIFQLEVATGSEKLSTNETQLNLHEDETDLELLSDFLMSVKEHKQKHATKLSEEISTIESDIKEAEKRRLLSNFTTQSSTLDMSFYKQELFHGEKNLDNLVSAGSDSRFLSNANQLENAYFSTRNELPHREDDILIRPDIHLLKNRENPDPSLNKDVREHFDGVGAFFDGLCKYARYSKLEVCGTLRNGDLTNTSNVICSLSFDRDEDYFAAAGVSKKVKIFDFQALYDNTIDIHYPVAEMSNESKLSCISWNSYIRNYLASTDYDGMVKLWDVSTGQEVFQFTEHEKRGWSVDFSRMDPVKLASGSDDCSVKVWSINERRSVHTIRNIANVCCVQFSSHSSNLLAFGSADYKLYCYDLRNVNIPWCVLSGHERAVSYVKFLDSETLVSASTDNTLKLWDLKRSSPVGFSTNACSLTLRGHTNEKNFVGLSVADGYISCGSETNEVFTYYKSLPMPITSHKFGSINQDTGKETDEGNGQFVSSVCWREKSNAIVAANSSGCIKVLRLV